MQYLERRKSALHGDSKGISFVHLLLGTSLSFCMQPVPQFLANCALPDGVRVVWVCEIVVLQQVGVLCMCTPHVRVCGTGNTGLHLDVHLHADHKCAFACRS